MNYWERALEIREETILHRRKIHELAEVGLETDLTRDYVRKELESIGIKVKPCGKGLLAEVGSGEKTIVLRADMDALPIVEESGLEFSAKNGNCHACGHDFHTAMLLSAAKLLKEDEVNLKGRIRFIFQPAEETFEGCRNMIDEGGLLFNDIDAALSFHVAAGKVPIGMYMYNSDTTMMYSNDFFKIEIKGKGGHGAYPELSVDPINIATHIYLALQEIISREIDPKSSCVISIGKIVSGDAPNIIPNNAILEGTIRSNNEVERKKIKNRIVELVESISKAYRGEAKVEYFASVPSLLCNHDLTLEMVSYMRELSVPNQMEYPGISSSASEDFSVIAELVPSAFIYLSAGFEDDRGEYSAHNPKVLFNEEVCPRGVAYFAHCAYRWLEEHR